MFRTLGLRNLCVINSKHIVVGIITRADLVASHIMRQANKIRVKAIKELDDRLGTDVEQDAIVSSSYRKK